MAFRKKFAAVLNSIYKFVSTRSTALLSWTQSAKRTKTPSTWWVMASQRLLKLTNVISLVIGERDERTHKSICGESEKKKKWLKMSFIPAPFCQCTVYEIRRQEYKKKEIAPLHVSSSKKERWRTKQKRLPIHSSSCLSYSSATS